MENTWKKLDRILSIGNSSIPTVFGDELSYYERLCRIEQVVNDCINNIEFMLETYNKFSEDITKQQNDYEAEMTTKYNQLMAVWKQLQDWINHYFENLDVQEEINNKLDEMYENGELDSLFNSMFNNPLRSYSTVFEMQNDEKLLVGYNAITLGYYSAFDGGGAIYSIVTQENAPYTVQTKNGYAKIVNDGKINVKQFGIKTDRSDQSENIMNLINSTTEYEIFFPRGTYYIEQPITINRRIWFHGEGICFNEPDRFYNGTLFNINLQPNTTALTFTQRCHISDLFLFSNSVSYSLDRSKITDESLPYPREFIIKQLNVENVKGIELASYGSELNNCEFTGFSNWALRVNTYNNIHEVGFNSCSNPMIIGSDNVISNIKFLTDEICMMITGGLNIINNIRADNILNVAITITGGGNTVSNCQLDYVGKAMVRISSSRNNVISNISGRCGVSYYKSNTISSDNAYVAFAGNGNYGHMINSSLSKLALDNSTERELPYKAIVINGTIDDCNFIISGIADENYLDAVHIITGQSVFGVDLCGAKFRYNKTKWEYSPFIPIENTPLSK